MKISDGFAQRHEGHDGAHASGSGEVDQGEWKQLQSDIVAVNKLKSPELISLLDSTLHEMDPEVQASDEVNDVKRINRHLERLQPSGIKAILTSLSSIVNSKYSDAVISGAFQRIAVPEDQSVKAFLKNFVYPTVDKYASMKRIS